MNDTAGSRALRHPQPRTGLHGRPGGRGAPPIAVRGRARARHRAARGGARRRAGRLPVHRARGARRCWSPEGLADRVPNKGTQVRRLDREQVRDVCQARIGDRDRRRTPLGRGGRADFASDVRRALEAFSDLTHGDYTTAEFTAAHLAIHRALSALTGSARLVAVAESLHAEVRLALAHVDRARGNADRAGALARRTARPDGEGRARSRGGRARRAPRRRRGIDARGDRAARVRDSARALRSRHENPRSGWSSTPWPSAWPCGSSTASP